MSWDAAQRGEAASGELEGEIDLADALQPPWLPPPLPPPPVLEAPGAAAAVCASVPVRVRTEQRVQCGGYEIVLQTIDADNVEALRALNAEVLPVTYNDAFYTSVWRDHGPELSCLALVDGAVVGGIACRLEAAGEAGQQRVYVMTLSVREAWRRAGIGSRLVEAIAERAAAGGAAGSMCLHVQTSNDAALRFYGRAGFHVHARIERYYAHNRGVDPPHAFFLRRLLGPRQ
ncbi:N-acetyltransferase 5 [Polyrhizophydium stewartii]|uniref:N-acetyltransferase 5 n=1 Tax=Polyrhizophydium stewartii TaxID=2732419 RepID=A0ABR4MWY8_9FUNG